MFSSALSAGDKDLRQVLDEVDHISEHFKTDGPDMQTVGVALHPAVWGAIKRTLLDRELRQLSVTDDLTSLYNRRGFFAAATQQVKIARRKAQDLLLVFCDIDGLKEINDAYGPREGDLALVRVADAIGQTFRQSDILARLGGDEFAILALEAPGLSNQTILRRLESRLEESSANEFGYDLSLSIGVSRCDSNHAVSLGELMTQAHLDLHEQKRKK